MELAARQNNNYSTVSTANTGFSLNWHGRLLIKKWMFEELFFKPSYMGKQQVSQKG